MEALKVIEKRETQWNVALRNDHEHDWLW